MASSKQKGPSDGNPNLNVGDEISNTLRSDHGVPAVPAYSAVIVGLVLIGVGVYYGLSVSAYTVPVHFAALILCVGLAIVLAAFGSRFAGKWRDFSVAGGIAGALILFVLQYETLPRVIPAVRGELRGTQTFQQVAMYGGSIPIFVSRRKTKGDFEFAVFPDDIEHADEIYINVTTPKGTEFYIYCVSPELFKSHFGDLASMGLAIRSDREDGPWYLYDSKNMKYGRFDNHDCASYSEKRNGVVLSY